MSAVEPAGDFDDLLQAYDMELAQPLNIDMKGANIDRTEERSNDTVSTPNDELSWEVMDVCDPSPTLSGSSEHAQNKNKMTSEDWVLEPDTDRKSNKDDAELPIIQSITSLREMPDEKGDSNKNNGDKNPRNEEKEDGEISESDTEGDGNLVIDTSLSAAENEKSPLKLNGLQKKESGPKESHIRNLSTSENPPQGPTKELVKERRPSVDEQSTSSSSSSGSSSKSGSSESTSQKVDQEDDAVSNASRRTSVDSEASSHVEQQAEIQAKPSKEPPSPLKVAQPYGIETGKRNEKIIVIEPTAPNYDPVHWDPMKFRPGSIKPDPERVTKSATISVSTARLTTVGASLSTNTTLSSAINPRPTPIVFPSVPLLTTSIPPNQTQKTIMKSPPGKGQQFVFRQVGQGNKQSFVRLGSQTLQQITRLAFPPGVSPTSTASQRMISVLMDRPPNSVPITGLPSSIQHIPVGPGGKPHGTILNTGNPNNPVKVLILPPNSQSGTPAMSVAKSIHTIVSSASPLPGYTVVPSSHVKTITSAVPEKRMLSYHKGNTPNSIPKVKPSTISAKNSNASNNTKTTTTGKCKPGPKPGKKKETQESAKTVSASCSVESIFGAGSDFAVSEDRFKRRMLGKMNLVKHYHPILSSNLSSVGFSFYSCHGCRDVFVNERSLERHRNRRSMKGYFNCELCKTVLLFFNKCQFRSHLLKHIPELKNFSKALLNNVELRPSPGLGEEARDSAMESELFQRRDTTDAKSAEKDTERESTKLPEKLQQTENETSSMETDDTESGLGLTISNVSSIRTRENEDISQTSKQNQCLVRYPVTSNRSTTEPMNIIKVAHPLGAAVPFTIANVHFTPNALHENISPLIQASKKLDIKAKFMSVPKPEPLLSPVGGPPSRPIAMSKAGVTPSNVVRNAHSGRPMMVSPTFSKPTPIAKGATLTAITPIGVNPKTTTSSANKASPANNLPSQTNEGREGGNIYCTECSTTFTSYVALQKHFHDADEPHMYKPSCCSARLSTQCCVLAHMRLHKEKQPFVCPDCGLYFRGEHSIFQKHLSVCEKIMEGAKIVYPCRKCPSWFIRIDELRRHIQEKHSECYLKCGLCPMAFKSLPSFKEHCGKKHSITSGTVDYSSIYKCPLCDSVFHDQKMKYEHIENHMNNIYATQKVSFLCYLCNKISFSYLDMKVHLYEKHKLGAIGNMCDHCGVDCGNFNSLVKHLKAAHSSKPGNILVVPSSDKDLKAIAGEVDTNPTATEKPRSESTDHSETSFKDKKEDPVRKPTDLEKIKEDSSTSRDTPSRDTQSPGAHSRSSSMYSECLSEDTPASGGRTQKCHICMHVFPDRKALIQHKKTDHGLMKRRNRKKKNGEPMDVPAKKMKLEEEMNTPELQVKSEFLLRFQCDDCDYRTTAFADLQEHRKNAHGVQACFPCHLCGETFESAAKKDEHQKNTHEGTIREFPYMCWVCAEKNMRKGYYNRKLLVKHLALGHKIAYKHLDTAKLDEMDARAKLFEKTKKEWLENENITKGQNESKSNAWRCVKCDFRSESRDEFTEHIHSHKLTSEGFLCHECGMVLTVMPALKNHLRLAHKIKKFEEYVDKYNVKILSPQSADKLKKAKEKKRRLEEAKKPGDPLECQVCYKKYPDQGALKNHMRTHGMAFIRSKRLAPIAFVTD